MPSIEIVRSNGTCYTTTERVGSLAEKHYFTVMTERWGKLFFTSEEYYRRWCREGRRQNERSGCFMNAKYYFDNSLAENEELMIVEAYQVEETTHQASETTVATTIEVNNNETVAIA